MDMKEEILTMLEKIGPLIDSIEAKGDKGEEMLTNMKAYVSDSKHFLEKENYLKSFEAHSLGMGHPRDLRGTGRSGQTIAFYITKE